MIKVSYDVPSNTEITVFLNASEADVSLLVRSFSVTGEWSSAETVVTAMKLEHQDLTSSPAIRFATSKTKSKFQKYMQIESVLTYFDVFEFQSKGTIFYLSI